MKFKIKLVKILKKLISYRVVKVPLMLKKEKERQKDQKYILDLQSTNLSVDHVFMPKRIISNLRNKNLRN